jgi:hypothetical protein
MRLGKFFLAIVLSLFFVSTSGAAIRGILGAQVSQSPVDDCAGGFTYSVDDTLTLPTGHNRGYMLFLDEDRDRLYAFTEGDAGGGDKRLALVQMSDLTVLDTVVIDDVDEFRLDGTENGSIRESDGRVYIVWQHDGAGVANGCFASNRCLNMHVFDGTTITDIDFTGLASGEMDSAVYTTSGNFVYVLHDEQGNSNRVLRRIGGDSFALDGAYNETIHPLAAGQSHIHEFNGFFYFSRNDTDVISRIAVGGTTVTTLDPLFDSNTIGSIYSATDVDGNDFIVAEDDDTVTAITEIVLIDEATFTINSRLDFIAGNHQGKIKADGLYDSFNQTIHSLRNVAPAAGRRSIQRVTLPPPMTLANFEEEVDYSSSHQDGNAKFSTRFNAIFSMDLDSPAEIVRIGVCTTAPPE